jgi:hypothetical protein
MIRVGWAGLPASDSSPGVSVCILLGSIPSRQIKRLSLFYLELSLTTTFLRGIFWLQKRKQPGHRKRRAGLLAVAGQGLEITMLGARF